MTYYIFQDIPDGHLIPPNVPPVAMSFSTQAKSFPSWELAQVSSRNAFCLLYFASSYVGTYASAQQSLVAHNSTNDHQLHDIYNKEMKINNNKSICLKPISFRSKANADLPPLKISFVLHKDY